MNNSSLTERVYMGLNMANDLSLQWWLGCLYKGVLLLIKKKRCCQLILEIMKILLQPTNGPSCLVTNKFHLLIMHILNISWLLLPSSLLLLSSMFKLWLSHLNPSSSLSCFLINLSCRGIKPRFTPLGYVAYPILFCGKIMPII